MSNEWPEIELSDDPRSWRLFWDTVLAFAAAEGATELVFAPNHGDDSLAIRINDKWYPLDAPPKDYMTELMSMARKLALGAGWGRAVKCFLHMLWHMRRIRATVTVNSVGWCVVYSTQLARFKKVRERATQ